MKYCCKHSYPHNPTDKRQNFIIILEVLSNELLHDVLILVVYSQLNINKQLSLS